MRKALAVAVAALILCLPAVAHAGRVQVVDELDPHVPPYPGFVADPGEANRITATRSGDLMRIRDDGAALRVGEGCELTSSNEAVCHATGAVEAELGDGDDTFTAKRGYVSGGDGNDTITADGTLDGGPGDDTLTGGPRRDNLKGGGGHDILRGRDGPDLLDDGDTDGVPVGPDEFDGGMGRDAVDISRAAPVTIDLRLAGPQGEPGEGDTYANVEDVVAYGPVARLTGSARANDFYVNDGRDARVDGRAGNDEITLWGGTPYSVRGGSGNDRIGVEVPADLACGAGHDFLRSPPATLVAPADCESVDFGDFDVIYDLHRTLPSVRARIAKVAGGFCPYDGRTGCRTVWAARQANGTRQGTGPLIARRVQRWRLGHVGKRIPLRLTPYGRKRLARAGHLRLILGRVRRHGFRGDFVADFNLDTTVLRLAEDDRRPDDPRGG